MGLLITIEGGEFTGKTSVVIPALKIFLEHLNIQTLTSREPGGTPAGEAIREKIFARLKEGATPLELAQLFNEAREIHINDVIIPFLGTNKEYKKIALLDRYLDSTRVYQGLEAGVPLETIKQLEQRHVKNYYPDITVILYFPENEFENIFNKRKQFAESQTNNRDVTVWDQDEIHKHITRQKHYLSCENLARQWNESRAFIHINAAQHPHAVIQETITSLVPFLKIMNHELSLTTANNVLLNLNSHELWQNFATIAEQQDTLALSQTPA